MDRLQAMETFVRVVERGSFSAVAKETGTTQSAVSKQVAALERALGARLIARTTRSLAPTDEGARYLEHARRLVAEIAEAEAEVRRGARQLRGWLRVAASVGFGRLHLLPIVRTFLAEHPDLRVDLRLNDGVVDLVEQGIDVAVRIGELSDSGLVARRIGTTRRTLVAHRDYFRRGVPVPRAPEDLADHDCIVYSELATGDEWTFEAGAGAGEPPGTRRRVRVAGRLRTNSSEVVRSAVLAGMGIGHAPTWLFAAELGSRRLRTLLPGWSATPLPIHLVCPPERRETAKVRAFGEHAARALATSRIA